jgi:3-methyladenine DNA glycosylase/8-oxoguanine DNA glycosylase
VRWQTLRFEDALLGLKLEAGGTIEEPGLRLSVWAPDAHDPAFYDRLTSEIEYRYNLQLDLAEFYSRFARDPQLGPAIVRWRGMRPAHAGSLYEYLVIAIVLQNATVRRTVQMMQALPERYGTLLSYDGKELYAFCPPATLAAVSEEELRALKVGYRARSIQRVSEAVARGALDERELRRRSIDEQRAALLALYGVGPASVGYILADVFHQLDEMNHISPWEQKIYSKLFLDRDPGDPAPVEELTTLFHDRFGGWRMLAVHYIWEDLFWQRRNSDIPWLEKLIRL